MYGFIKGGKHSYNDFNLRIIEREFNPPNKFKIKEIIPGMNGAYDFSTIATNGEDTYEERIVKYVLDLRCSKSAYGSKKFQITNWLSPGEKTFLYDDLIPGYHFLAECEAVEFSENPIGCEITVEFKCYPFMISNDYEGSDIWDTFDFEMDVTQDMEFYIDWQKEVSIINIGRPVCPVINTTAPIRIVVNDGSNNYYDLQIGDNKFYDLKLKTGENNFTIGGGYGTVKFIWKKVML